MTRPSVIVCVTDQKSCSRLIKAGYDMAQNLGAQLRVLSIQPEVKLGQNEGTALDILFGIAKEVGADMTVYYSDDSINMAISYLKEFAVSALIAGEPGQNGNGFIDRIAVSCPEIKIYIIDKKGIMREYDQKI